MPSGTVCLTLLAHLTLTGGYPGMHVREFAIIIYCFSTSCNTLSLIRKLFYSYNYYSRIRITKGYWILSKKKDEINWYGRPTLKRAVTTLCLPPKPLPSYRPQGYSTLQSFYLFHISFQMIANSLSLVLFVNNNCMNRILFWSKTKCCSKLKNNKHL